jgi:cation-transporting ATPase I
VNLGDALRGANRLVGAVGALSGEVLAQLDPGRHRRRVWSNRGRAHIEVRGVHLPGHEPLARNLEAALRGVEGVIWAEVNATVGRVVVSFESAGPGLYDLVAVVERVEAGHAIEGEAFPRDRPEHPADVEPQRRATVSLNADAVGLTASVFGQLLRAARVPAELAALVSLAEQQPRVRQAVERLVGAPTADLGLSVASALAQAVAQGPVGLAIDTAHRLHQLSEAQARRAAWERRELELAPTPGAGAPTAVRARTRPVRLRDGPVEHYANRTTLASLAAGGTGLALGSGARRSAGLVVAGLPKASRLGRETFAAALGRELAHRDVVIMDPAALRRLDRLDVAVLDARALLHPPAIASVEAFGAPAEEVRAVLAELFDPARPQSVVGHGQWVIGPLRALRRPGTTEATRRAARRRGTPRLLGVARGSAVVATVALEESIDPLADSLAATVRRCGLELVLAGGPKWLQTRLGVERSVPGGRRLASAVRASQATGQGVLLISVGEAYQALAEADCSLGVALTEAPIPWSAHLMAANGLADARLLVEASAAAREVSARSAQLALAGSGVGGLSSVLGPAASGSRRATLAVNLAALGAGAQALVSARAVTLLPQPPEAPPAWHEMEPAAVLAALNSAWDGLRPEQVRERTVAPQRSTPTPLRLSQAVGSELANPLTPVLGLGAVLAATVGSVADAGLVAGVVGANALIGGVQRLRAAVSIERLVEVSSTQVTVRRYGVVAAIGRDELVVGDLVELAAGQMVPADCHVLAAETCEVDESVVTGESLPVLKSPAATPGAEVADRSCMLFEGTTISSGWALAAVVAVGSATEVGRSLADAPEPPPSGVEARLGSLTALTLPVTMLSGAAVTGIGLLRSRSARLAIASGVSLMVAAVPEGLPLLASVAQQAAARRLSTRGALVRHPRTIEALGRVDTLCFDKTGTLTEGEISLQRISDGERDEPIHALGPRSRAVLAAALRASPAADLDDLDRLPHATDRSVLAGGRAAGVTAADGLGGWNALGQLAFDPARGFHAAVGVSPGGPRVAVKGAPEVILPRCTRWSGPHGSQELGRSLRVQLNQVVERLAGRGLRVLAVAERPASERTKVDEERIAKMELLGFLGLADPLRPTADRVVADLAAAGIEVVMITGDHPGTAAAVGKELGILDGHRLLAGRELDRLSDDQLDAVLPTVSVFARVTPSHKVRIVRAYQRLGRVVAMTGDGANDAPAIRLAHAGIALGHRGSPAAREAADLVVVDDRMETILASMVEGRALWTQVRDALAILVGGNLGEVAFTVAATALAGASPLGPRQLLLVNMLTDMLPAMTISLRPPLRTDPATLLNEGPDASLGPSLNRQIVLRAATTATGALGAWLTARVASTPQQARTVALVALVGTQLGQTAVIGGRSPLVLASTAASGAVLAAIVQTPMASQFFGSEPLDHLGWAIALGASGLATVGSAQAARTGL